MLGCALGLALGLAVGLSLGLRDGLTLGRCDGDQLGLLLGLLLGKKLGLLLGLRDGLTLGLCDGDRLGLLLGLSLGEKLGLSLGEKLGLVLGIRDGDALGLVLGLSLGLADGDRDGLMLGLRDGLTLGLMEAGATTTTTCSVSKDVSASMLIAGSAATDGTTSTASATIMAKLVVSMIVTGAPPSLHWPVSVSHVSVVGSVHVSVSGQSPSIAHTVAVVVEQVPCRLQSASLEHVASATGGVSIAVLTCSTTTSVTSFSSATASSAVGVSFGLIGVAQLFAELHTGKVHSSSVVVAGAVHVSVGGQSSSTLHTVDGVTAQRPLLQSASSAHSFPRMEHVPGLAPVWQSASVAHVSPDVSVSAAVLTASTMSASLALASQMISTPVCAACARRPPRSRRSRCRRRRRRRRRRASSPPQPGGTGHTRIIVTSMGSNPSMVAAMATSMAAVTAGSENSVLHVSPVGQSPSLAHAL